MRKLTRKLTTSSTNGCQNDERWGSFDPGSPMAFTPLPAQTLQTQPGSPDESSSQSTEAGAGAGKSSRKCW